MKLVSYRLSLAILNINMLSRLRNTVTMMPTLALPWFPNILFFDYVFSIVWVL